MKNQKGVALIAIILVLALTLAAGFLFISARKNVKNEISAVPTPVVTATPTAGVDISGWSSYFDETTGISFLYPSEMPKTDYREGVYKGAAFTMIGPTQMASGRTQSSLAEGAIFKFVTIPNSDAQKEADKEYKKVTIIIEDEPTPAVSTLNTVTIDGKTAYQYKAEGMGNAKVTFLQVKSNVVKIIAIYAGFTEDEEKYYEDLTDQILSTMKIPGNSITSPECGVCGPQGVGNIEGRTCAEGLICKPGVTTSTSYCVKAEVSTAKCEGN